MISLNSVSEFGTWLRAERKHNKITLVALGAISGYSPTYICYVENGKSIPTLQFIEDICTSLGYDMSVSLNIEQSKNRYCS